MPENPEEFAVFIGTLGTIGGGVITAIIGIIYVAILAWQKKIKPLLEETRATAQTSAQAAQAAAFELQNNHGTSTRDAVDRIEKNVNKIDARLTDFGEDMRQQRRELHQIRETAERTHTEIFNRLHTIESANNPGRE